MDLEKAQREQLRWRILVCLNAGRPAPVSEVIILQIAQDLALPVTPTELRRELHYLQDRKLIRIEEDAPVWLAHLTHYGVDLVEYTTPIFPGIARPPRD